MIHFDNPFRPDPGDRDPARRFRGRLAAGVTIVTSGAGPERTGLTVSSLFVIEGSPALVHLLVGPSTDLWSVAAESGHFVVHVCAFAHHQLADMFAGLSPSPGGLFTTVEATPSDWGPVLTDLGDRLYCSFVSKEEIGWSGIVIGRIDEIEVSDLDDPLIHFRSSYRRLGK
jgi:flavin reductase (DIM6/NTAB) family NADH-FMN oxidoreductase RutF